MGGEGDRLQPRTSIMLWQTKAVPAFTTGIEFWGNEGAFRALEEIQHKALCGILGIRHYAKKILVRLLCGVLSIKHLYVLQCMRWVRDLGNQKHDSPERQTHRRNMTALRAGRGQSTFEYSASEIMKKVLPDLGPNPLDTLYGDEFLKDKLHERELQDLAAATQTSRVTQDCVSLLHPFSTREVSPLLTGIRYKSTGNAGYIELLTGASRLKAHTERFQNTKPQQCAWCSTAARETTQHHLFQCDSFAPSRQVLMHALIVCPGSQPNDTLEDIIRRAFLHPSQHKTELQLIYKHIQFTLHIREKIAKETNRTDQQ